MQNIELQGNSQQVIEHIKQANHIFIFHHTRPDGDCLGAAFGLKNLIQLNFPKKQVYCIGENYNAFAFMNFDFTDFTTIPEEQVMNRSLAIMVDGGHNSTRIEKSEIFMNAGFCAKIRIDHHPAISEIKYDAVFVNAHYAACCEQIAIMAKDYNWIIDAKSAQFLALGIITDTGRFNFDSVSSQTYDIMAWMLEKTNFDYFGTNLNLAMRSVASLKFESEILNNFILEDGFAHYTVTKEFYQKFNLTEAEASDVGIIANIENAKVWAFFIEIDDNKYRTRLRSNGVNVNLIANQFGGGGHNMAAGVNLDRNLKPNLIAEVKKAIKAYESQ